VQLKAALTPLLDQRAIEGGRLLFRSPHITDREASLTDLRDLLDRWQNERDGKRGRFAAEYSG
jgi:hypothetical protein